MPQIPTVDANLIGQPAALPRISPAAGGIAASGIEEAAQAGQGVAEQWAQRYADARRQADAAQATADATTHFDDMQHRWTLTIDPSTVDPNKPGSGMPTRAYSEQGFAAEAKQYGQTVVDGIQDPLVKSYTAQRIAGEVALRTDDTAHAAFALEGSARAGQLDTNLYQQAQSAANATNPLLRAKITDDATASIHGAAAAGWIRPEEAADKLINFRSMLSRVDAQKYIRDADMAMDAGKLTPLEVSAHIADPSNFPGLPAEMRQQLADQAIREGRTITSIKSAAQAETDRQADKLLKQGQQTNEVKMLADIDAGHGPDAATLEHLGETQQISTAGYMAARAALAKQTKLVDDLPTYDGLNRRMMAGEDVGSDVLQAQADGKLSVKTGQALLKANTQRLAGGETALDKANFATLKTGLSGTLIENGFAFDKAEDQARARAVWTEGQKEWTERVIVNRENSTQVLADMLPRLQPMIAKLPDPALGPIKTMADVNRIGAATYQARQAGQLDDAHYADQVRILNLWRESMALGAGGATGAGKVLKPQQGGDNAP